MLFTGPSWLSLLSPFTFALVMLIASLVARHWRRAGFDKASWLSIASVALAFALGGVVLAAALAGFVLFTHRVALAIERAADRQAGDASGSETARRWVITAVGVHAAMIAAAVRAGILAGPVRGLTGTVAPIGVSFFAFHGISYVVDVYRRRAPAERSLLRLTMYLVLLPAIVGGPLDYAQVAPQLARRRPSLSDFSFGVRRLLIGVWKIWVVAELAGAQADVAFAMPSELGAFRAWVGLVALTVQMYYGFSGYADMGLGLGRMIGFRLPENFRWPYVGETVREFWRRWHMGLTAWFREYADVPLNANRTSPLTLRREAPVVMLCAIWYGAGWTFVVWGLYHVALIALERAGLEAAVKRLPAILRHVYLIAAVMAGWVILRSPTLGAALLFFKALAGLNASAVPLRTTIPPEIWLLLAAGAFGCAPLFSAIRRWTVTIDALFLSILVMMFAVVLFAWRLGGVVLTPVLRLCGLPGIRANRRGGNVPVIAPERDR